jgi:hypothetical protein
MISVTNRDIPDEAYFCKMQLRKGDRVRFLNETGEGVITRIMGEGMAMVEVEDGFEYPYLINQLVPDQPIQSPATKQTNIADLPSEKSASAPQLIAFNNRYPDGIYLAFIPHNQAFPSAGKIDIVLYNHNTYSIYFTLAIKDGTMWTCIQAGALGPGRQTDVDTLTPQDIDNWGALKVDVLFYSDEVYIHHAPVSELIKLKGAKFFKDSTYTAHVLVGKKAYVSKLIGFTEANKDGKQSFLTEANLRDMLSNQEKSQARGQLSKPARKNQQLEKEVDLHIEQLLDNWSGMTNGQLLDVQLRRMQQELDGALADHLNRIVFIHGVGNGRLKAEIHKILRTYRGIRFHDASYSRYGFGATEVVLWG